MSRHGTRYPARRFTLLAACILSSGCITTLTVEKISEDNSPDGIRYSLPIPVLQVCPGTEGTISVQKIFFPDANNRYAISGHGYLASFKLGLSLEENGLLSKLEWNPDDSGVAAKVVEASGNLAKADLEQQAELRKKAQEKEEERREEIEKAEKAVRDAEAELEAAEAIVVAIDPEDFPQQHLAARIELEKAHAKLEAARRERDLLLAKQPEVPGARDPAGSAGGVLDSLGQAARDDILAAELTLDAARAHVDDLKAAGDDVVAAERAVVRAEARLEQALHAASLTKTSEAELDAAERAVRQARSAVRKAELSLDQAVQQGTDAEIDETDRELQLAEHGLRVAEENLSSHRAALNSEARQAWGCIFYRVTEREDRGVSLVAIEPQRQFATSTKITPAKPPLEFRFEGSRVVRPGDNGELFLVLASTRPFEGVLQDDYELLTIPDGEDVTERFPVVFTMGDQKLRIDLSDATPEGRYTLSFKVVAGRETRPTSIEFWIRRPATDDE